MKKEKESKIKKFFKTNIGKCTNKYKILSVITIIGIVAISLSIFSKLTNSKNIQTESINPELERAKNYAQFEEGDDAVDGTDNVKFSAFFLRDLDGNGNAEKMKGTCKEIGEEDTLYMDINVQTEGFLKDAKIQIDGQNFYLQTALIRDDELKDNYIGNNIKEINFNKLVNGTQKLLEGIVRSEDYSSFNKISAIGNDISKYSVEDNKIVLTGTYVDEEGNETPIKKEVDLTIDWYGTTKTTIYNTSQKYSILDDIIDETQQTIELNFYTNIIETEKKLNISKSYVKGIIPQISEYSPIDVNLLNSVTNFTYNKETREFIIEDEATVNNEGIITNEISNDNSYQFTITYPVEAYENLGRETIEIHIPVEAYYEGYNNPNTEFTNPYRSNTEKSTIIANFEKRSNLPPRPNKVVQSDFKVIVGQYRFSPINEYYISKQKPLNIYNGISESEKDDRYIVTWRGLKGTKVYSNNMGMVMKESKTGETQKNDQFIKTDNTTESMENISKNIGIYFENTRRALGEDGWIKVYNDETDELLMIFDKSNLEKHSNYKTPYYYETPVKHIRVETSLVYEEESIVVYNIKEIDDEYITNNYTEEEFKNLQYINSNLVGYIDNEFIKETTVSTRYEEPYSTANISISNNTISTQATEEHEKITIQAPHYNNQKKWENGSFLVKFPETIISAKINDIIINNPNVKIDSYELYKQDEIQFIKINTNNIKTIEWQYEITIDVDLTPDPRIETTKSQIELYASNGVESDYYYKAEDIYDVNDNLNTKEQVNKTSTSINLIAPNSLLTSQIASNYDTKGNMIISPEIADVKPNYSVVDNEEKTAQIGMHVKNNYTSTISDIVILGKIPFEGNTYVISEKDLGSNFTTKMTSEGIQVPAELQEKITVYYSENENPGKEIDNKQNGWKTKEQITNWDNIKTFLISFGEYEIRQKSEYIFTYKIKIPNGIDYNKVAYSHHGVYFNINTEEGKYSTQIEPNKLGFRIAEKYNVELIKYQSGKEKLIPGSTYKITEEGQEEGKTAITKEDGKLTIKDLYAERTYIIEEIKAPNDYNINEEKIKIIGHIDKNGNLTIEKTEGTTKEDITVEKNESEEYKAIVKIEDEAKARIKIIKKEKSTEIPLKGIRYKITGPDLTENGRSITTNVNGETTLGGLKVNEEYTLQEVKAEGYYLASQIKFKIVNNDGTYNIEVTEGTENVKESSITEQDCLPIGILTMEDEKIPTYNLEITKIKKTTEININEDKQTAQVEQSIAKEGDIETLSGARFELYKESKLIGEYTTGADGKLLIEGLYKYVDGKDEKATYRLKEVLAPVGYSKIKDITFKVQEIEGKLEFQAEDNTKRNYTSQGNTLKLQIEDSPIFKLIKRDEETQEVLSNVKFAIYNIENKEQPAKNSKQEILGTLETINGKQYYTLTTNEKGEITADLQEGLYKAVELEAPEKYEVSNKPYYFGIGATGSITKRLVETQVISTGSSYDSSRVLTATSDGGYIAVISNSVIIKYNSEDEIDWSTNIVEDSNGITIATIAETKDGGYIVGGYFNKTIQIGDKTLTYVGQDYNSNGIIIKYNGSGEIEWATSIEGDSNKFYAVASTSDGGYVAGGYFTGRVEAGNETLTNNAYNNTSGMIIKYNSEGEVIWTTINEQQINRMTETSDEGFVVGYGVTFGKKGGIIKYNKENQIEWTIPIEGEVTSITETSDGGYIAGIVSDKSEIKIGNDIITNIEVGSYTYAGIILKFNDEGKLEWTINRGKTYGGRSETVIESNNGGFIAVADGKLSKYNKDGDIEFEKLYTGNWNDQIKAIVVEKNNGDIILVKQNGNIIKNEMKAQPNVPVKKASSIGGNSKEQINSVAKTSDEGYVAVGDFNSSEIKIGDKTLISVGNTDGMIIKYNKKDEIEWAKNIGGTEDDSIQSVTTTIDGGYIIGGYFKSSEIKIENQTLTNAGNTDGMVIKYNKSGKVEWARNIGGSEEDKIKSVKVTNDGGCIVVGDFSSNEIQIGSKTVTNLGNQDGIIIKYNATGGVEWVENIGGSKEDLIQDVTVTIDGGCIIVGYFNSDEIKVGNETLTNGSKSTDDYANGMIIKYNRIGEVEWTKSIEDTYENYIYSVTATSDGGCIVAGETKSNIQVGNNKLDNGSIIIKYTKTGETEYAKNINKTYSNKMKIYSITETSDGGYVLGGYFDHNSIDIGEDNLVNMDTNYSYTTEGIIIKYDAECNPQWAKSIKGTNNEYVKCIIQLNDESYIAVGSFESNTIQVSDKTLTNAGNSAGMLIRYREEPEIPDIQEMIVENARKEYKITTETKEIDGIKGGNISGEDEEIYETVKYGDSNTKEIKITPNENYEIIAININGQEHNFETLEDGSYTMPTITNITEDKNIEVTYSLKDNKIIINKVDSDTKQKLTGAKFKLENIDERAVIEVETNSKGQAITQIPFGRYKITEIEAPEGYELNENPLEIEFTADEEHEYTIENKKATKIIVHHYIKGTTKKIAEDEIKIGKRGEKYTTSPQLNLQDYELEKDNEGKYIIPENAVGRITEEETEVNYYYNLKDTNIEIETPEISITSTTEKITEKEQKVPYEISYKMDMNTYTGNATITIIYKVPYEIDLKNSNLDGGTYDETNKTITWIEEITEIDTVQNGKKEINITKQIELDYQNIDVTKTELTNTVTGQIELDKQIQTHTVTSTKDIKIEYVIPKGEVEIKYIDKSTKEEITDSTTKSGIINEEFDITENVKNITGYTLIEQPEEKTGIYTEEKQTKTYYYAKNSKVIINYIEEETNKELATQKIIEGYEGKEYETKEIDIENYIFIRATDNIKGTMTKEDIIVNYYYTQNTSVKVEHIDKETEEIIDEEIHKGKIGDLIETKVKDFENYILVKSPENPNIVMEEEQIIVKYYYAYISAGVIEKHIDEVTKELLYSEVHKGNEGDEYKTSSKTFENYEYIKEKQPENAEGKMKKEAIEIKYYYKKKSTVTVQYVDKLTGKELEKDIIIEGLEKDPYETETKEIKDYVLVENTKNTKGEMTAKPITITYYYIKKSAGVIEKHIDLSTKKILQEAKHEGKVTDKYEINPKEIDGYELVKTMLPTNEKGEMKEELIEVEYYYSKQYKIIVEYIDKANGEKLGTNEIIGTEGTKYETETKQFENYDLEKVPENAKGVIKDKNITVTYYYSKKAKVQVQYLEKGTEKSILDKIVIEGHIGDKYQTEKKDIQYYNFVEVTEKTSGEMLKEETIVTYYYKKQIFNLKVDGWLESININGIIQNAQSYENINEMYKLELSRNIVATANIKITYKIRITNIGEIEGYAEKIQEIIPKGFEFYQEDNKIKWIEEEGVLTTTDLKDNVIGKDDYKEIEIILRWNASNNNFGQKINTVVISQTRNPAKYEETNKEYNTAKLRILIAISTGLENKDIILFINGIQILFAIGIAIVVYSKRRK